MSESVKDSGVRLKVMINREKTKVLFAEADSDFADVLLSFLTLPLGRIAKLLEKHNSPVFGSITSLYRGLANLDNVNFTSSVSKRMLLEPRSASDSVCRNLKLDIADSQPVKYYSCGINSSCSSRHETHVYMYYGADNSRCNYGYPLNHEIVVGGNNYNSEAGLFMIKSSSFIISDDLVVQPYSTGFFEALSNLGVTGADVDAAELRNVTLGTTDEVMDLFKCCLLSKTPLTDFILNKGEIIFPSEFSASKFEIQETSNSDKKIVLKLMVHKSRKKVLFAQAKDDFVELLFSFLIISIGGIQSLTNTNTGCTLKSPKGEAGYVKKPTAYMVTDDLTVTLFHFTSVFPILSRLNISLSEVEEVEMAIGLQEGLSILKAALTSTSALTNGLMDRITMKKPKQEQ